MIRVRSQLVVLALVVANACTGSPPDEGKRGAREDGAFAVARRIAGADATLSGAIERGDGWRSDGSGFTSPGWRSARTGPGYEVGARLPERASAPIEVRIGRSELYRMSLTALGANPSRGVEASGRVTYSGVYQGVDLLAISEAQRVELLYIIREPRPELRMSYRIDAAPGLSRVSPRGDGGVELRDSGGNLRLAFEPAYAIDARGVRRDARYERTDDQLDVVLDLEGLALPVLLDPTLQVAAWEQLGPPTVAGTPRLAYDSSQQQSVLVVRGETWQWDGARWWHRSSSGLGDRDGFDVVYQSNKRRTLLFGGSLSDAMGSVFTADTAEWDGFSWRKLGVTGPAARAEHAMCYDETRHVAWLFGGATATSTFGDFWKFDGSAWKKSASGPSGRRAAALAHDPVRDRVVLFGGRDGSSFLGDTWEFDGSDWTLFNAAGPAPRSGHRMVYDDASQRVWLYGGENTSELSDLWSWDGTSWTKLVAAGPAPQAWQSLAYDASRKRAVLFDGETWEFDGNGWLKRLNRAPEPREGHALAYDQIRRQALLFGGNANLADTWTWNGDWQEQPVMGPAGRRGHGMAFDASRGRTLLFGGTSASPLGDAWEFDGAVWQQRATTGPLARSGFGIAYDSARGRTVVFGGSNGNNTFADTWEWDGTSWSRRATSGPVDRGDTALAYDPKRQRSVLFGGRRGSSTNETYLSDTWEWDGQSWSQRNATGPGARAFHVMAYDAVLEQVVLYGGSNGAALGDSWTWDGAAWAPLGSGPPPRLGAAASYDSDGQRLLLFGGKIASQLGSSYESTNELWALTHHGAPCTAGSECPTGYCVDGVCCNQPSCGPCQACNLASNPGLCAKVCDLDLGASCTADSECVSGACVDGACCETSSCGNCESCNTKASPGVCAPVCDLPRGASCDSDDACESGFCSDGLCCNKRCDRACESCNEPNSPGKCVAISGESRPGHPRCPDAGTVCGATCDGSGGNACVYASAGIVCGAGDYCSFGAERSARCNGSGTCLAEITTNCEPYACGAQSCRTECSGDSDCYDGYYCDLATRQCLRKYPGDRCEGIDRVITEGGTVECAPYVCSPATNQCLTICRRNSECSAGNRCDQGICAAPGAPALPPVHAAEQDTTCGCRTVSSGRQPRAFCWLWAGLGLALGRRFKNRAASRRPRRSGAGSRAACGRARLRTRP